MSIPRREAPSLEGERGDRSTDMDRIEEFGKAAGKQITIGALDYFQAHGKIEARDWSMDTLSAELKAAAARGLTAALAEAKEALDCRMGAMATTTFGLSMRILGIEAAKATLAKWTGCDKDRGFGQCSAHETAGAA
jgi:hypothetical protein